MAAHAIGLDIGRSFIKIVELNSSKDGKSLKALGVSQTPPGGMETESVADLAQISQEVKNCYKKAKVGTSNCVVSLSESQIITRLIELPVLTDKELSAAINWEAEQYIPLPIKDVSLQYKVVSKTNAAGKMEVVLTAAPTRVIQKYINVVKSAGLKVVGIEPESTALTRALIKAADPATVIVSLGAVSTEMIIASGGSSLFSRSIATGGSTLTRAIMAEFNLPQAQAEQYKQAYGILEDKLGGKVAAVLKPILDILTAEILKAVEFAHGHISVSQIARVVISGGGAYLPGLPEFLVNRTSLEVSIGDPWADFKKEGLISSHLGQGSLYSVSTGLALWS